MNSKARANICNSDGGKLPATTQYRLGGDDGGWAEFGWLVDVQPKHKEDCPAWVGGQLKRQFNIIYELTNHLKISLAWPHWVYASVCAVGRLNCRKSIGKEKKRSKLKWKNDLFIMLHTQQVYFITLTPSTGWLFRFFTHLWAAVTGLDVRGFRLSIVGPLKKYFFLDV